MKYMTFDYFDKTNLYENFSKEEIKTVIKKYNLAEGFYLFVKNENTLQKIQKFFFDLMLKGVKFNYVSFETLFKTPNYEIDSSKDCKGMVYYTNDDTKEVDIMEQTKMLDLLAQYDCIDRYGEFISMINNDEDIEASYPFEDFYISSKDMIRFEKDYAKPIQKTKEFNIERSKIMRNRTLTNEEKRDILMKLRKKMFPDYFAKRKVAY